MQAYTTEQIISNLEASGLECPKLSDTPDERSLLAVIEYLKAAELASSRFDKPEEVVRHYTRWACLDIAQALHEIYKNSDNQKIVELLPSIAVSGFARLPTIHYVVAFDGLFYDILGKHTQEEIEAYCSNEFCWSGAKFKSMSEEELSKYPATTTDKFENPVITYCVTQILKRNPHLAAANSFNNN